MKKNRTILFIYFAIVQIFYAQYQVKSEYLLNPEKNIDYIIDEAEYWTQFYDSSYGGFFSFVDSEGNVTDENIKALCPQSRLGYAYARAFMVTGNEKYLDYAHRALKFLQEHGWDKENGGWYFTTNREGVVTDGQGWWDKWNISTKQSFQQHYALLGQAAIWDATGGNMDWSNFLNDPNENSELSDKDWTMRGYNILMEKMWDSRPDYLGHYAYTDLDWASPKDKGFTSVGDAMTTNAVILYLLTQDDNIKNRLLTLADNVVDYLAGNVDNPDVKLGFPEVYNNDWEINTKKHKHLLGHVYKAAWVVSRAYMIDPQEKYREAAEKLLNDLWNNGGYDKVYGGPYKKYDWQTGEIIDSSKNHWTLEQGVLSGLINYYIADDSQLKDRYLQMADESLDFYIKNIRDYKNGGSFSETNREGTEITDGTKGNVFGANYHGTEMAYFSYLYGSFFLKDTTVTLYYYFQPVDTERTVTLYPFAFTNKKLKIKSVELNDILYSKFDRDSRTLTIAGNVGGKFKVVYEKEDVPNSVADDDVLAENFSLNQNYPNPFNPSTKISFTIPKAGNVKLNIYNSLGQLVQTLVNGNLEAGNYKYNFNAKNLPSGVYFYRLSADGFSSVRKMILIK